VAVPVVHTATTTASAPVVVEAGGVVQAQRHRWLPRSKKVLQLRPCR
jgi:hypothetical protein